MKFLLIDIGASLIKIASYNSTTKKITNIGNLNSPFLKNTTITKNQIKNLLINIVNKHTDIDALITCSIIGGGYIGERYYSWKHDQKKSLNHCLVSGIFLNSKNFHIHAHHFPGNSDKLRILGYISNIPIYSALGDTYCVINSLQPTDKNLIINIGTGSQVIYKNGEDLIIHKYIPAGRTFLTFQEFFSSIKLDFFQLINTVNVQDVINSTLKIDLNVFPQSHKYKNGGSISGILENSFDIKNFIGSFLKSFVLQYEEYINLANRKNILLSGGISIKIKNLKNLFHHYYPNHNIKLCQNKIECTHIGMVKYIERDLI